MSPDVLRNDEIRALLTKLEAHAPGEKAHAERVAVYAVATGERLGLQDDQLQNLRWAAELHDIGKLQIESQMLTSLKPDMVTLRTHADRGAELLKDTWPPAVTEAVRYHHERWDGAGYLARQKTESIPVLARIIAAAEAFDVLSQPGYWRQPLTEDEARRELESCAGAQFDPKVVAALLEVSPLIQPIHG